ncbi:hypothetical protein GX51_05904 [Blastomyces parvus]|uniref:Uncharacterized protein n=1 Tax=Blastomyces parvus TaxID=2060905 RepID=A0A2B7WUI3_9EURO|nr:hypothetical protein GX51_05904 [Blastomyces parvus]
MKQQCVPFDQGYQLLADIDKQFDENLINNDNIEMKDLRLPGHPARCFSMSSSLAKFLCGDLCTPQLDLMAPKLWMMTTYSSSNIYPLHFQRVKGREIVISEFPRLHLIWKHSQIFIKPLPKYLLSFNFWDKFLTSPTTPLDRSHDREQILSAAKGLLRTYYHLIQHESDFDIAQSTHLLPQNITWTEFSKFIAHAQSITDAEVSPRYCYGEIRLTRLNFYSMFFLHRSSYEWGRPQYSAYFNRFYGHILFIFAMASILLSAMQVELAAETLVSSANQWASVSSVFRYFSVVCMLLLLIIALLLLGILVVNIGSEWVYAVRSMRRKREQHGV